MPGLLALKLFLVPCLIAGITLAGRRWGAGVAGMLAGFPVVTGPILLFVAIEQGGSFAADAAAAAIIAVLCNVSFGIAYAWTARKRNWPMCFGAGLLAYFALVALFQLRPLPAPVAFILTIVGLALAPRLFPAERVDAPAAAPLSASDLPYRMVAGALLVILVTVFSARLGPNLTGLLSVFPVMATVLAVFSHRNLGQAFAVRLLRGMVRGFYIFAVFCLVLAWTLPQMPVWLAFGAALTAAGVAQAALMHGARMAAGRGG